MYDAIYYRERLRYSLIVAIEAVVKIHPAVDMLLVIRGAVFQGIAVMAQKTVIEGAVDGMAVQGMFILFG